ncbi:amidohydrolase [Nocardia sp. 2]|uniref:Amidohydrolase n=1 Tax=Nocardia acididurans TaxID=2802282 RepID=A0ABS1M720_9NOCA|nr:amidohydrolase [Nocardia acididurans]MBL1076381.1 amidohydrolase [Nocardia acididurans]
MAGGDAPEAVAVHGDRIVAVGARSDCDRVLGGVDQVVDLDGACLTPGFVDPHCHPLMHGQVCSWVDCSPQRAPDIAAMIKLLRAAAAGQPPDTPVRGFGYEPGRLSEGRHPTCLELDQVADDREVYVMNVSGHGGVVNSYVLQRNSVSADTADPPGGRLGRFPDGSPNGEMWDSACDLITGADGVKLGPHAPNFHLDDDPDTLVDNVLTAQHDFLSHGVTCVADTQVTRRELSTYQRARDSGRLVLRVSGYIISSFLPEMLALGLGGALGDDRLQINGVKVYVDGCFGGCTCYLPEGYAHDPHRHGQLYHTPDELTALIGSIHRAGLQVAIHAQSGAAIGLALDAIAAAVTVYGPRRGAPHRIEHVALPAHSHLRRMRELGVWGVLQPADVHLTGDWVRGIVGDQGEGYGPAGWLAGSGVGYALSSDAPVCPPNPMLAVASAAHRTTIGGATLGDPDMRLDVAAGLAAHTRHGAEVLGRQQDVGAIRPGMYADFAVLESDPLHTPLTTLADLAVTQTWIGGRRVWSRDS